MSTNNNSHRVSSGLTLSSSFYLRNFYKSNSDATKSSSRKNFSRLELNYEDSRALKRAVAKLSKSDFKSEETSESLVNAVKAYATTFNNSLSSATSSRYMKRYATQLKKLSKSHEAEFEQMGITVESDGKLKVNETLLKASDPSDIGKIFSEDSKFSRTVKTISRNMNSATYDSIMAEMTGNGTKINIML